jgi:hypothetical protein
VGLGQVLQVLPADPVVRATSPSEEFADLVVVEEQVVLPDDAPERFLLVQILYLRPEGQGTVLVVGRSTRVMPFLILFHLGVDNHDD